MLHVYNVMYNVIAGTYIIIYTCLQPYIPAGVGSGCLRFSCGLVIIM